MSLSREHFIELARIVREEKEGTNTETLASAIASFCMEHNSNFDRQRFLNACTPEEKEKEKE